MNKKQLLLFLNELRWLLESGVHLLAALKLLAQQSSLKVCRSQLHAYGAAISQGNTLSSAVEKDVPHSVVAFIRCGEASGELDNSLALLCEWLENMQQFYSATRQLLAYPLLVFSMAILLVIFMLAFIVPQFEILYQQLQAPLPSSTQYLVSFTESLKTTLLPLTLSFLLAVLAFIFAWRFNYNVRYWFECTVLTLPSLGKSIQYYQHARFCQLLSLLLRTGIPLVEALHILAQCFQSPPLKNATQQSAQAILQGQTFHQALRQTAYFEPYLCDLVQISEACGKLDIILQKLADYYEQALKERLNYFKQYLQPSIILLLGLLLAIWLLLLYYPLLQLGYAI